MPLFSKRRRRRRAPYIAAAGAAALAAGAAVATRRRGRSRTQDARREWRCNCGQAYLVHGTDRHRVYWLPDARESDPLLSRECVSCGAALPSGHESEPVQPVAG